MGTFKHAPAEGQGARAKMLRPKGTGTVAKEGDRYRARLPGSRRTIGLYETKVAAQGALEERLAALSGQTEFAKRTKLAEWMAHMLEVREGMRLRNGVGDRSTVKVRIAGDPIGKLGMAEVSAPELRAWIMRLLARGLSGKSVQNTLTLLRRALQHAVNVGMLERNPARDIEVPRSAKATTRADFEGVLGPDEQARFLVACSWHKPLWRIVAVSMGLGLRRGEALSLRWSDVHADDEDPSVVIRYGKHGGVTKGGKPRRLPLFGMALDALRELKELRRKQARLFEDAGEADLVFPGRHGGKSTKAPIERFHEALRAAGVTRNVRWHDLRHTCGTSLLMGWWGRAWSVVEVQRLLGHSQASTTERYLHARNELIFRAAREMRERDAKETGPFLAEDRQIENTRGDGETQGAATEEDQFRRRDSKPRVVFASPRSTERENAHEHVNGSRGRRRGV